jgi:hypothetical protein
MRKVFFMWKLFQGLTEFYKTVILSVAKNPHTLDITSPSQRLSQCCFSARKFANTVPLLAPWGFFATLRMTMLKRRLLQRLPHPFLNLF